MSRTGCEPPIRIGRASMRSVPGMRREAGRAARTKSTIVIRRATPEDLDGICAVAEAVRFDPLHAQVGGFLVYMHGRGGYAARLAATDLFYVATDHGEVVGFAVGYEDHSVADLVADGIVSGDVLRAWAATGGGGRWIYGDQIAIHPAHAGQGIGMSLVWELYLTVKDRGIGSVFVAILHDPPNARSKAFCESLGFVFRRGLRYGDGRLWGIYSRDVPAAREG